MASGAFGESLSVVGITGTDTAASSDASPTDTTSTPSSDTSSTDASSSSTDTSSSSTDTTLAPAPAPAPYIVTFKSGVSDAQQQDDIAAANGTAGDAISVLHMYSPHVPRGGGLGRRANARSEFGRRLGDG